MCELDENDMKTDIETVIFANECRATLDRHDEWNRGWILHGSDYVE